MYARVSSVCACVRGWCVDVGVCLCAHCVVLCVVCVHSYLGECVCYLCVHFYSIIACTVNSGDVDMSLWSSQPLLAIS